MTDAGPPRAALSHLRRSRARSVPDSSHAQEPTAPRKNLPALRAAIHLAQEMGTCLGRGALLFRTLQKGGGPNFAGIDAVMRRSMGKRARGRPLPWIRRGKSRVWVEEVSYGHAGIGRADDHQDIRRTELRRLARGVSCLRRSHRDRAIQAYAPGDGGFHQPGRGLLSHVGACRGLSTKGRFRCGHVTASDAAPSEQGKGSGWGC